MSRALKTSGFLGLTNQMLWGMYNTYLITPGGPPILDWMVGAHAHFGVLGILAIVVGFAVDRFDVRGTQRTIVTWFYIAASGCCRLPLSSRLEVGCPC